MDAVLGLAFTRTGPRLYPIFGTLLGWLGVALTGSDTSSNVLFGNLQKITAREAGAEPDPDGLGQHDRRGDGQDDRRPVDRRRRRRDRRGGQEGDLLRAVLWHSIALALLVGGIVWLYAHVLPWVVVVPLGTEVRNWVDPSVGNPARNPESRPTPRFGTNLVQSIHEVGLLSDTHDQVARTATAVALLVEAGGGRR